MKAPFSTLPQSFKPLLWSFDFSEINLERDKKTIVLNTINYGDLSHWRWVVHHYGRGEVARILTEVQATEIKPRTRRLVSLLFSIPQFNHAPRSAN